MPIYLDERGYDKANEMARRAGSAEALAKGLLRVAWKLGHILRKIDPDNEFLAKKKIDEVYYDTELKIFIAF